MDVIFHWLHLTAAAVWVGGAVFFAAVLAPALRGRLSPGERAPLMEAVGGRYAVVGWGSLAVLAVTGLLKQRAVLFDGGYWRTGHGWLLAIKMFLAAAIALLTLAHDRWWAPARRAASADPGSAAYRRALRRSAWSGRAILALSLTILYLAARLRWGGVVSGASRTGGKENERCAAEGSRGGDVMKITKRLTADHRMFRKIIREVDGFTRKRLTKADKDRLVRLVSLLKRQLSAHAWFEDMFFYPVLREAVEAGDSLPQGTLFMSVLDREHKAIEDRLGLLLAQLESETAFACWPRTFSFFFQELMAHMGKEENTLFPLAEKSLGAEVLEDLSRKADRHRSGPPRSSNK